MAGLALFWGFFFICGVQQLLNLSRHSLGLPTQIILDLIGDLANALSALFDEKIVHRDIKPTNILYFSHNRRQLMKMEKYSFKLCDFGEGRAVVGMNLSFQTATGTYHYMAPQVLESWVLSHKGRKWKCVRKAKVKSLNTEITDLWSLGVTLFRCVTGRLPFDPRPYKTKTLLEMLKGRPNKHAIACTQITYTRKKKERKPETEDRYRQKGNAKWVAMPEDDAREMKIVNMYEEHLRSAIHPTWFLEAMTMMIRLLLDQNEFEKMIILLTDLSKLRSRVVYNVRMNMFYLNRPCLQRGHSWYMGDWKLDPSQVGITGEKEVCVLNEGQDVRFISSTAVAESKDVKLSWRRIDKGRWSQEPPALLPLETNDMSGNFLIVCERSIDGMSATHPVEEESKKIDEIFERRSISFCSAVLLSDLLVLKKFIDNIDRISLSIENQRKAAIERLNTALYMSSEHSRLRNRALTAYQMRRPRAFAMKESLDKATAVVQLELYILDKHDEERNVVDTAVDVKRKKELVQSTKNVANAQKELQTEFGNNCQKMMSSLRRIIKFNELADNLTAEFFGTPLPHARRLVHFAVRAEDVRYEPPPIVVAPAKDERSFDRQRNAHQRRSMILSSTPSFLVPRRPSTPPPMPPS